MTERAKTSLPVEEHIILCRGSNLCRDLKDFISARMYTEASSKAGFRNPSGNLYKESDEAPTLIEQASEVRDKDPIMKAQRIVATPRREAPGSTLPVLQERA